jgi:hypothetical protein
MTSLSLIKRTTAAAVDAVAEGEAEIRHLAEVERKAKADALRLGQDWLFAENQAAAEQINRDRIEAERSFARCTAQRPELEQRLAAAKAEAQRQGLARHHAAIAAFAPKLIAAVEAAAVLQVEAIRLRDRAEAELGTQLVTGNIPHLAFAGLLLPDLVQIWAHELRRAYDPPSAPRAPFGRITATATAIAKRAVAAAAPPPTPNRQLRNDPPAQGDEQTTILFLKGGVELPDGQQSLIGDRITLAAAQGHSYALHGLAEIVPS